jgi:hypothetical protein
LDYKVPLLQNKDNRAAMNLVDKTGAVMYKKVFKKSA